MKQKLNTAWNTRQYMLYRDFEIYYYNDRKITRVDAHVHDYYEIYFFVEGDVSIEFGEGEKAKQIKLKHGDIVIVPPGLSHHAIIHSHDVPYRRFVLWITVDYLSGLMQTSPDYGYLMQLVSTRNEYIFHNDKIAFNAIQTKVFHLLEEIYSNRFAREAKISLCLNDLILHLNRVVYEKHHERSDREEQKLSETLIDYIDRHLEDDLSLDYLASQFYVSKYHIAHIFKDNIGMPIHQYVLKKRLEACKDTIRNGAKISEAYLMFGFKDYSGFYKAFRKEYGISPKEWQDTIEKLGVRS